MPKAKDLRIHGVAFTDAVKRMIAAPVPAKKAASKKAAKANAKKR